MFVEQKDIDILFQTFTSKVEEFFKTQISEEEALALQLPEQFFFRSHSGELLLLLTGVKPCVLICPHYEYPEITKKIIDFVYFPCFQHIDSLELCEVNEILVEEITGCHFKSQWLLRNKKHRDYHKSDCLLKLNENNDSLYLQDKALHNNAKVIKDIRVGLALGYPTPHGRYSFNCDIEYMFGDKIDDIILDYVGNFWEDGDEFFDHFLKCQSALSGVIKTRLRLYIGCKWIHQFILDMIYNTSITSIKIQKIVKGLAFRALCLYVNNINQKDDTASSRSTAWGIRKYEKIEPFNIELLIQRLTSSDRLSDEVLQGLHGIKPSGVTSFNQLLVYISRSSEHPRVLDNIILQFINNLQ